MQENIPDLWSRIEAGLKDRNAEEKIEYLSSDPKTLALYKARESSLRERANMISSAQEEGINIGENRKAIKVAENFLRM
ncbi:MAG: hypothetical protein HGA25_03505, partial [Clostridiales bacterium]|nr:hypothetical protein [Clostridiales bacterium]